MQSLKDFMGDVTRGDGRRFSTAEDGMKWWFEPIFLNGLGEWYGLDNRYIACHFSQLLPNWCEWQPEPREWFLYESPVGDIYLSKVKVPYDAKWKEIRVREVVIDDK